jgi:monovalent cation:proton antiporter-2 (CPA2) family protein
MGFSGLTQLAVFLAAAAIVAPLARRAKLSSVLGYLVAGVVIGPYGVGLVVSVYEVGTILHVAEFGVALLLFLIGLELRPKRFWAMRKAIFGVGPAQVILSAAILSGLCMLVGVNWEVSVFLGLALSLSATPLALQILEEKGELRQRHGRVAISVLLFQDLAAIPLIALVPLLALREVADAQTIAIAAAKILGVLLLVFLVGRFVVGWLYRLVTKTGVREATTASALLAVVCIAILMQAVGLSPALGAFVAGALLADSEYRHQIEADISPFSGLLVGLFFIAIGMSLNLALLSEQFGNIILAVICLLVVKAGVLFALGLAHGMDTPGARRLALAVSQGGEFGFLLLTTAAANNILTQNIADFAAVVITLSMMATPFLLLLDEWLQTEAPSVQQDFDSIPEDGRDHVIVAGFGRFGQIVARVLLARKIPFTALDSNVAQVDFVAQFGNKIYYGNAAHPGVLEAAQIAKARAFVLAIDDVEDSLKTAEFVRRRYPHVPIFARARDRQHAYRLIDLGVTRIYRETLGTALGVARDVLEDIGLSGAEADRTIGIFREHDERRLLEDYKHASDWEKLRARARRQAEELQELFEKDLETLSPEDISPKEKVDT